ncbi:hypothetical protein CPJCM30710_10710 [Clostridium polyendosporum]|uniref:Uncharacterized protein n=1 Tax=Clostridium polyendosporum TaxID=69208 RepID=A0A919RZK9_9CLOT|nr:hypothetical protein [Clostridium polyendosporum]GIM28405.1 hypothetical protein CPJCM30710_10710 [Clostridium polyendosporum]
MSKRTRYTSEEKFEIVEADELQNSIKQFTGGKKNVKTEFTLLSFGYNILFSIFLWKK